MDFALILVVAGLVTGCIWAIDTWLFRPRRLRAATESGDAKPREPVLVEYSRTFFPIIIIVLLVRSFLYEPFRIPSRSMMPTLLVGDFIFVNKYVYGLRLPVLNKKVLEIGEPRRGDVVVFRKPSEPSTNFIKRVIGLPGDRFGYRDKQVFINGEALALEDGGTAIMGVCPDPFGQLHPEKVQIGVEQVGDVKHEVLFRVDRGSPNHRDEAVPEGHYFVMGDNRDCSSDSRRIGFIPEDKLVGKAVRIWMSWEGFPLTPPVWNRIGDRIQ